MSTAAPASSRIGYFGRKGSFSHEAATRRFGSGSQASCPTIEEAFARLQVGEFSQIVVPIENASSGIITNTADQLMRLAKSGRTWDLQIREALNMEVGLVLMALDSRDTFARIYSHRAPFDHSREWLHKHYPGAEHVIVESTSEAAALAAKQPDAAAIAGLHAAEEYGLRVISQDVGAEVANQTTFVVVGAAVPEPRPATHTSVVFELPHRAGSLVGVLEVLSRRGLNLTKILSRPIPGRFEEYRFMIEFQGAEPLPFVVQAVERIRELTTFFAIIGAYPVLRT